MMKFYKSRKRLAKIQRTPSPLKKGKVNKKKLKFWKSEAKVQKSSKRTGTKVKVPKCKVEVPKAKAKVFVVFLMQQSWLVPLPRFYNWRFGVCKRRMCGSNVDT